MTNIKNNATVKADLSRKAYPWSYLVVADRFDRSGPWRYLFFSPRSNGTLEQSHAVFSHAVASGLEGLDALTSRLPYTELLSKAEARMVSKWLKLQHWFNHLDIERYSFSGGREHVDPFFLRAPYVSDTDDLEEAGIYALTEADGWFGAFPLHVVVTRLELEACFDGPRLPGPYTLAFEFPLLDKLLDKLRAVSQGVTPLAPVISLPVEPIEPIDAVGGTASS